MKLELHDISKRFGEHRALRSISLWLEDVRSLVLIGPSGGGKSTLLRIIGGLEIPETGRVVVNGEPLTTSEETLRRYRRTVGTVFQTFNLFPHLTALENITLPLEKVHGVGAAEARELAQAQLARFRLEAHAGKKPAELSGGQRQRVAIARALSIRPQLILFDEPTSALDPEMTAEVLEVIEELRNEGRDLILVTHHMAFARKVGEHVVFLSDGAVVEAGPASEVFGAPKRTETAEFFGKVLRY